MSKCGTCGRDHNTGYSICSKCLSYRPPVVEKKESVIRSRCCDADVKYSKGSYLGAFDTSCERCEMYCKAYIL